MAVPPSSRPEISDLVVNYDRETLQRLPVRRDKLLDQFAQLGMSRAKNIIASWPHHDGCLDNAFVDTILVRSHLELQRLSEEFQQGARVERLLVPVLAAFRASGVRPPYRVVDVGCGLGYVVRWLAHARTLGEDVELLGCDYNARLIQEAEILAKRESLRCSFAVTNAFRLDEPATIYMSTGVVHHFRGPDFETFLAEQSTTGACGYLHSDIKASWLAPLGSWMFHVARMRQPLAQHDGVLSAQRAHPTAFLANSARRASPDFWVGVFDGKPQWLPILHVMQTLMGLRLNLADSVLHHLGPLASRVEVS
jgi:2-polyprenyl-3-methyl-5-hydroxy-6-metoxy-1,4-benzoquinol methylase